MSNDCHVCFCSDSSDLRMLRVAVDSLLRAASGARRVVIHLFRFGDNGDGAWRHIEEIAAGYGFAAVVNHDLNVLMAPYLGKLEAASGFWNLASWGRCFIADALAEYDGNVVYLDTDVLVAGDIAELVDYPLGGRALGAVAEDNDRTGDEAECGGGLYFNSGVLLIDCRRFREENGLARVIEAAGRIRGALAPDQDALNDVFSGRVEYLPAKWNVSDAWVERHVRFSLKDEIWRGRRAKEVLESVVAPAVMHFIGGRKPLGGTHRPWRKRYRRAMSAAGLTPPSDPVLNVFYDVYHAFCMWHARRRLKRLEGEKK